MTTFIYTAVKQDGEKYERTVEAVDRFAVYTLVRKEGGKIVDIKKLTDRPKFLKNFDISSLLFSVNEAEKIVIARNIATMIKAGLPLSRALHVMERQTKNKVLKKVLRQVNQNITKGTSFHESIEQHPRVFPPIFVSMARAGEESGQLAESLLVVAKQIERSYTLKKKIKGALIYPSIIVIAMFGIGILMLIFVVPTLTQTFTEFDIELPKTTQAVIATSNFFVHYTFMALGLISLIVLGLFSAFRTRAGRRMFEFFILHIPIISTIVKETNSARTARTLASLLTAGVEIVEALSITEDVLQNSYYKDVLKEAGQSTGGGRPIAEAFIANEDLYPILVGEMLSVGEETGQVTTMLDDIALFYESEVEQKTKDLSTIIEPFLMIFIGAVVGFFAVSMISPIYSISSGI